MKKSVSAGGIVVSGRGKICLVWQPNSNTWAIPKGHVEKGETLPGTAVREIYEETGLKDIKKIKKLGIVKRLAATNKNIIKVIHFYLFITENDRLNPLKRWKHAAGWYSLKDAVKINSFEEEKEFITKNRNEILDISKG